MPEDNMVEGWEKSYWDGGDDSLKLARKNLFDFAKRGATEELNILLKKVEETYFDNGKKFKDFLDKTDELGNTPQHYAAREGHPNVIQTLAIFGADLQACGQEKMKVPFFAAHFGRDSDKVWECIDKIRELEDSCRKSNWTILPKCGQSKSSEPKNPFHIGETDRNGFNILHHAVQNNLWSKEEGERFPGYRIIKNLINLQEIKVIDQDHNGNNILHLSLMHGKPEVFLFLKERAEDNSMKQVKLRQVTMKRNLSGKLPLHIAIEKEGSNREGN